MSTAAVTWIILASLPLTLCAGSLAVSPECLDLGDFPAWESRSGTFVVRNTGDHPVGLLRVRSGCSCTLVDFTPCRLDPGQETPIAVSVPADALSGAFSKPVYLETDAPGQQFLKLTVSGTVVPVVEVLPERAVYLGRLEPFL